MPRKKSGPGATNKKGQLHQLHPILPVKSSSADVPFTIVILKAALRDCYDLNLIHPNTEQSAQVTQQAFTIETFVDRARRAHPETGLSEAENSRLQAMLVELTNIIDPMHANLQDFRDLLRLGVEDLHEEAEAVTANLAAQDRARQQPAGRTVEMIVDEFFRFLKSQICEDLIHEQVREFAQSDNTIEMNLADIHRHVNIELKKRNMLNNTITEDQELELTDLLESIREICTNYAVSETRPLPEANLRHFFEQATKIIPIETRRDPEVQNVIEVRFSQPGKKIPK